MDHVVGRPEEVLTAMENLNRTHMVRPGSLVVRCGVPEGSAEKWPNWVLWSLQGGNRWFSLFPTGISDSACWGLQ